MNANEITFGIEIECAIPSETVHQIGLRLGAPHVGIQVPTLPNGWTAQRDGSIRGFAANMIAVEIVSPVLQGIQGINDVRHVVAALKSWGAEVNSSTGLHIHVGVKKDAEKIQKLVRLTAQHEKAIFATTGSKLRERNMFCAPIVASLEPLKKMNDISQINLTGSRYKLLNLTNLCGGTKNTAEFRAFGGTLNITKILGYVQMCVGLVEKAWTTKNTPAYQRTEQPATGVASVNRMVSVLGWTRKGGFGVIDGNSIPAIKKEFSRLAVKYDAAN
jgi:hypothetical protein